MILLRMFGSGENKSPFVKHLAFENANPTCQEAICAHKRGSLSDYVKLCSCIGSSHEFGLAIVVAVHHGRIGTQPKHVLTVNSLAIFPENALFPTPVQ